MAPAPSGVQAEATCVCPGLMMFSGYPSWQEHGERVPCVCWGGGHLSALAALGLTLLRVPCPAESPQSCLTRGFLDRSQPGSFVHGAFQTRTLEWVAVPSWKCRGSSRPRGLIRVLSPAWVGGLFASRASLSFAAPTSGSARGLPSPILEVRRPWLNLPGGRESPGSPRDSQAEFGSHLAFWFLVQHFYHSKMPAWNI